MKHFIGTAGWTIPKDFASAFPKDGSHLQRYAEKLNGVEINSSFYRPHQAKTYKRWADETHGDLRFSVKMTKVFTHEKKLDVEQDEIALWLAPVKELGGKLGAILVQIPPKQDFVRETANAFFKSLRKELADGITIAFEPRHISWTNDTALKLLEFYDVTKVEADPERCPSPADRKRARYVRLHGSPAIYKSNYEPETLKHWADELEKTKRSSWVIFDNTTFGFASQNALDLREQLLGTASSKSEKPKDPKIAMNAKRARELTTTR